MLSPISFYPILSDLLLAVLGIDSLDFFAHQLYLVLQFLHLAVHLVDKAVALFRRSIEETKVVLVGLYLLLQLFILTHQTGTLIVQGVLATLSYLLDGILELLQPTLGNADIQLLIGLVKHGMILLV